MLMLTVVIECTRTTPSNEVPAVTRAPRPSCHGGRVVINAHTHMRARVSPKEAVRFVRLRIAASDSCLARRQHANGAKRRSEMNPLSQRRARGLLQASSSPQSPERPGRLGRQMCLLLTAPRLTSNGKSWSPERAFFHAICSPVQHI
ncbi:hypothetical protein DPEC_G00182830 [Dallia pectoralis]|uniref:Uncharacterized protein n=1 Tax=Dallia pectoralis TaxID=75939 RepID=A0ACC2GAL8_DALPE|nr:hypothetical protein DPEC_G00182830 [Dallia pectoralis]